MTNKYIVKIEINGYDATDVMLYTVESISKEEAEEDVKIFVKDNEKLNNFKEDDRSLTFTAQLIGNVTDLPKLIGET